MSETIKDLDFSPARGKSPGSCSISGATLFVVGKQELPRPLWRNRGERRSRTCGGSHSPRQPGSWTPAVQDPGRLSAAVWTGWKGPQESRGVWAQLPRFRRMAPTSTPKQKATISGSALGRGFPH